MAKRKGKGQKRGRIDRKKATDVDENGQAMLVPPPRDLKHHLSAYLVAKAKVDKANKELQHVCKNAEASGVSMKAVRMALGIAGKDPLSAKAHLTQMSMVFQESGAAVQINIHEAKYADPVEEAKVKGFADGKAARDRAHNWVKGSPAARQYDESYDEGQLENMPITEEARKQTRAMRLQEAEMAD